MKMMVDDLPLRIFCNFVEILKSKIIPEALRANIVLLDSSYIPDTPAATTVSRAFY